ncbi:hypothetical protein P153DRAFT_369716 [Dothidotthia symphoricarpi CBS 119687]|uniref:Uncharacterized protein n=1 Tax=Dothidotthia symphoricarpi CBS 119687 TaxID=1392245 RepID=A0A6A6A3L3_9PLEO|nr:uncharacterized protein P153DRAFT_369716 [Dothidotthia symphoricarpi CBS 119687]KAF2125704.1 hypothetical protein P153DRAFT_369716 [Dothidotthia symphoricarpi CBS 119687]
MGIDMSKFGKKHAFKPAVKPTEPKKTSDIPVSSYGLSSKQRVKTDAVPKINPTFDIRTMTHAERVLFANGPEVAVMMGDTKLAMLAKYVLMQCSAKAYRHFTENPNATTMTFKADSMDMDAAKAHLQWMDEMTFQGRVYSLTLHGDEKNDVKNLNICRAARVLGMNNIYVGHFTRTFCDRIRSQKASPAFISLVADLAYPENDPIFECLANNLVNMRVRSAMPKGLEALLEKHAHLRGKMEKIEKRMMDKRRAEPKKVEGVRKPIVTN